MTLTPHVVAVVVTHDGAQFLPRTLAALAASSCRPDLVVAVDTGSNSATVELLRDSTVVDRVVTCAADTGFAAAVHAGLAEVERDPDWIWLLHDDSAPEPDCLQQLLAAAAASSSLAVLGPKVLGWDDPRRLLEVGITITGSGRRETGLEPHELDQGQHDGQRDVLAVGSAGSLVRGDAWRALGGYATDVAMFRDDLDLGWRANRAGYRVAVVTDAAIHHAEAASRHRREIAVAGGRPHFADRSSALLVLVGNARRLTFPLRWLRLLLGSLVRTIGFLLTKVPALAWDELRAVGHVLLRPDRIRAARRRRFHDAPPTVVPQHELRAFFPRATTQLRQGIESARGVINLRLAGDFPDTAGPGLLETGPVDDDEESMLSGAGWWHSTMRRPGVVVVAALLLVALIAWRSLIVGGALFGGALLPIPGGASDLWHTFTSAWHPVATGSSVAATPYVAVLALVSTLVLGKSTVAVALVLLAAIPVAAWSAYVASLSLRLSRRLRVWASVAYALSPPLLAAIAQGRIATIVVALLLPWFAVALARMIGTHDHPGSWAATATASLLLAVMMAFAPIAWWIVAALVVGIVIAGPLRRADRRAVAGRIALLLVAPWVALLPWSLRLLTDPATNLLEAGVPLPRADTYHAWQALVFLPGGSGSPPIVVGVMLLVLGLAAIPRATQHVVTRAGLGIAGVGLLFAVVVATVSVTPDSSAVAVTPWPGPALVFAVAGALVAVSTAARGARKRLAATHFGWQQPTLVVLAVAAVFVTAVAGVWWMWRGAAGPLQRGDSQVLPAFVAASADQPQRTRTLVIAEAGGRLEYSVLRDNTPQLGDAEVQPSATQLRGLSSVVSELASGRGGSAVDDLRRYAVQYVLVSAPVDPQLQSTLDAVPGLVRVSNPSSDALWGLQQPTARLSLATGAPGRWTLTALPSQTQDASAVISSSSADRTLLLAENADPRWHATLSGSRLAGIALQWQQTFAVPKTGGALALTYDGTSRTVWLVVEALVVATLIVVAIPGRRRDPERADP